MKMMKKTISMALTLMLSMPKQWHRRIITRLFELSICVHFVGYQMVIRLVGSSIRRQLNTTREYLSVEFERNDYCFYACKIW